MIQNILPQSALISEELKAQMAQVFSKLDKNICLKAVVDMASPKGKELAEFLATVSTVNDKISFEAYSVEENCLDELDKTYLPVVGLYLEDGYTGICFHGVPGGKEVTAFVRAIYNVAGPGQDIEKRHVKAIEKINKKVNLKVCVSLACHYCSEEVTHCQRIASLNKNVEAEMIDATLYQDLIEKYKIERIPLLIINDDKAYVGQKDMDQILAYIKMNI